jgi:hypothetical protein
MAYERLVVERQGPVGWLIFDRPDVGNAMDARMMTELEEAWRELDEDPAVRVIMNTGNGRNFQTGLDVAALSRDKAAMTEQSRRTRDAELRFTAWHNQVWTPVIAAVNGNCAGGGLHFVADADIVIAASDAMFFDTHVSLGQAMSYEGVGLSHKMAFDRAHGRRLRHRDRTLRVPGHSSPARACAPNPARRLPGSDRHSRLRGDGASSSRSGGLAALAGRVRRGIVVDRVVRDAA